MQKNWKLFVKTITIKGGVVVRIDSEVFLTGSAAHDFYNQMKSVDMAAITSRDSFLADVNCWIDEAGILSIDASGLDIDLSVLKEEGVIAARPVYKEEKYASGKYSIDIHYSSAKVKFVDCTDVSNSSYCLTEDYYAQNGLNCNNISTELAYVAA